jgi:hypothetical protein
MMPTTCIVPVALHGLIFKIQWARYCSQLTRLLKNLSMPITIGRTVKPTRSNRNDW